MFRLLRYFSVISAVAVTVSAALLVQAYRMDQTHEHVQLAEEANLHLAEVFARSFWPQLLPTISALSKEPPETWAGSGELQVLDAALRTQVEGQPISKIKIFNDSGAIIYSPVTSEIGRSAIGDKAIQEALAGRSSSILSFKDRFEGFTGVANDVHVVETYRPIIGADGRTQGIFELYFDVSAARERLSGAMLKAAALILACFATLYGALVLVVRRAERLLHSQQRALAENQKLLNEQKDMLHLLLNTAGEAILGLDAQGRVTFVNQAALALLGQDGEEMIGRKVHDLIHHALTSEPHSSEECEVHKLLAGPDNEEHKSDLFCRRDGTKFPAEYVIRLLDYGSGGKGAVMVFRDVSKAQEHERHLRKLAHFDALTRLPNRIMMADRMRQAIATSRRSGEFLAVCMLDLDGFKPVNDTYGHKAGDQLLREVATRLVENIRGDDTAARIGGDEFALLLGGIKTVQECETALQRILKAVSMPYSVMGAVVQVSASIGVTIFPNDGVDSDQLLRHADQAMYKAKQSGKNCFTLFDPGADQRSKANHATLRKMGEALEGGQFFLLYQPVVNCRKGLVLGAEALIRWRHPLLGDLTPGEFLPLIERDDLIIHLGEMAIAQSLSQIALWRQQGLELDVAVNLSARQLHRKNFIERLKELIQPYPGETYRHLKLEIVENAALEDTNSVADILKACNEMGIHFALDDFGTGFSSLVHLKRLAPAALKIDQTFVADMLEDSANLAIVEGVVAMAMAFQCDVVAEGVENIDQLLMLLELGCETMQGYVLSRPLPPEAFSAWARQFMPDPRWQLASNPRPSRGDFQLLLAEANHRHWVEQLIDFAETGKNGKSLLLDHRSCHFGLWYYGEGFSRYGGYRTFGDIESLHANLHKLGQRLVGEVEMGDRDAVVITQAELEKARDGLIQELRHVRAVLPHAGHV